MPVDLSTIPDVASRNCQPSIKRWFVILLIFMFLGGFFTSWLWPSNSPERGALFWHCFISAPLAIWIVLFGFRWLAWLSTVWPANGWDNEREQDIENEIQRGQYFLVVDAASVCLPHVVTSGALTEQFLLPQGIKLPSVIDSETQSISYIAQFSDSNLPVINRIQNRFRELLNDPILKAALSRRKPFIQLQVILQVDPNVYLSQDEQEEFKKQIATLLPASNIRLLPHFGLSDIDNWMDNPESIDSLLVLSVCLRAVVSDGDGEAAVALLLRSGDDADSDINTAVHFHRPEQSKDTETLLASARQALEWGKTDAEHIESLWFSGMGTENKTQSFLSENKLRFPRAEASEQITDIDLKTGLTGVTSPWLAVALAAGQSGSLPFPQLIMSASAEGLPWWMVIHPGQKVS
ncbi:hypothetical protein [Enterobacter sp. 61D5]|uniref:hypothetical protein n=1 Tax=Enterobacter sp. 61D5 TaxID=3077779 RepID=UPI002A806701|nr:hypothetical protein [Enterobacter sp. 61D5]